MSVYESEVQQYTPFQYLKKGSYLNLLFNTSLFEVEAHTDAEIYEISKTDFEAVTSEEYEIKVIMDKLKSRFFGIGK